jgi:hypothetical protein
MAVTVSPTTLYKNGGSWDLAQELELVNSNKTKTPKASKTDQNNWGQVENRMVPWLRSFQPWWKEEKQEQRQGASAEWFRVAEERRLVGHQAQPPSRTVGSGSFSDVSLSLWAQSGSSGHCLISADTDLVRKMSYTWAFS